jgi:hypothetical protein
MTQSMSTRGLACVITCHSSLHCTALHFTSLPALSPITRYYIVLLCIFIYAIRNHSSIFQIVWCSLSILIAYNILPLCLYPSSVSDDFPSPVSAGPYTDRDGKLHCPCYKVHRLGCWYWPDGRHDQEGGNHKQVGQNMRFR